MLKDFDYPEIVEMSTESAKTILVVEDEESLRMAMQFILKSHGYHVLVAASGNEALEIIKNQELDLILSDVRMPDGDGIELLRKVRELHFERPVLFLVTGFTELKVEEVYDMGADAVFGKPFDRKALLLAIRDKLQPAQLQWQDKDLKSKSENVDLHIQVSSLESEQNGQQLKIGRGGFFIAADKNSLPADGTEVNFSIQKDAGPEKIEGTGIVRWSRRQPDEFAPAGCGIEIKNIQNRGLDTMIDFITAQPIKAFIPKG